LRLTPAGLLSALVDHWDDVAGSEMPSGGGSSLLALAGHVLVEPPGLLP